MSDKDIKYITFEEFVNNSGVKESTIKRKYKQIPGITKTDDGFQVISGTRYPCDLHRYKLRDSYEKRYVLLKCISKYKYVTHTNLRLEYDQFVKMLEELLSAQLIEPNNLGNDYGANAYDCSILGDKLLKKNKELAIKEMTSMLTSVAGKLCETVISTIYK